MPSERGRLPATSTGTTTFNGTTTLGTGNATFAGDVAGTGAIDIGTNELTFDGTTAQTVDIAIDGAGTVTVNNANGVTFNSAIGSGTSIAAFTVDNGDITLQSTVSTATISLNRGNTVRLSGFTNGQTVITATGALSFREDTMERVIIDAQGLDLISAPRRECHGAGRSQWRRKPK